MIFDGCLPIDVERLDQNVTAAGTNQASATPLLATINIVTTVPPGSGVMVLRPARITQTIVNAGANPLNVFPLPGMVLYPSTGANLPFILHPNHTVGLVVHDDSQAYVLWVTSSFG